MQEERKRILKMVEDGTLSADEALVLLEALSDQTKEKVDDKVNEINTQLTNRVDWESNHQNDQDWKQPSLKQKLTEFLEGAYKKIKDVDLDFNFGPYIEVNHIFQHKDVDLKTVTVDVANGSVTLIPWEEQDVRIECKAKVYGEKDSESARKAFLRNVLFSIDGNKLRYQIEKKQMKVASTFYIPQAHYEEMKIRLFNGHIEGEGIIVKELKGKTANGHIELTRMTSEEMEVETANGYIHLGKSKVKHCEAETINGKIKVDGEYKKVDLQSLNGNIQFALTSDDANKVFLKTTTGSIDFLLPNTYKVDGELKSNLGGFECKLPGIEVKKEKNEVVQKYMRFAANPAGTRKLHLDAETKTGSIVIKTIEEESK